MLWAKKLQGDDCKYFLRPMATNVWAFFFRDQVLDNILWSLVAVVFMTFWECLMWYAYANGIAPMITFVTAPIWFLLLIVLVPIEAGFHSFFFIGFCTWVSFILGCIRGITKISKRALGRDWRCIRQKVFFYVQTYCGSS